MNHVLKGVVLFANVGRGNALLKEHRCSVFWGPETLPLEKVQIYGGETDATRCKMRHPTTDSLNGKSTPNESIMRPGDFWFGDFTAPARPPDASKSRLWAVGFVYFEDGLDPPTRHGLYFGRWYDPSKQRFIPLEHDAYENEE
jgi:hypothetical protein